MFLADDLSSQVLYEILHCKNLAELSRILGEDNAAFQQQLQIELRREKKLYSLP